MLIAILKELGPHKFMELVNETLMAEADPDSAIPYHEDCFSFHMTLNDLLADTGTEH